MDGWPPEPRFRVATITGYPIHPSGRTTDRREVLSAHVIDGYYGSVVATVRSSEYPPWTKRGILHAGHPDYGGACPVCGGLKARHAHRCAKCADRPRPYGFEGALAAAEAKCAELNAWDAEEAARAG